MADHLLKARQSNAEAKARLDRVREREGAPDEDEDRPTLDEIVEEVTRRHQLSSTGELVIDAEKRTTTLRAPPWVLAVAVVAIVVGFVAWVGWG